MKQDQIDELTVIGRAAAPTPRFFRVLRSIGIVLAAVSGAILTAPVPLPPMIITVAGYAAVAGSVLTVVSQVTVKG